MLAVLNQAQGEFEAGMMTSAVDTASHSDLHVQDWTKLEEQRSKTEGLWSIAEHCGALHEFGAPAGRMVHDRGRTGCGHACGCASAGFNRA